MFICLNERKINMNIFDKLKFLSPNAAVSGKVEWLIVGLGNPGDKYSNTRHNAGWLAVSKLCEKYNLDCTRLKFKSLCADAMISGKRCLVMKPTTYMNNSGEAVVEAMNYYKIPIEHVLVICDDISLEPSVIRIRRKGTDGGQKGLRSIIELTGSEAFPRIKIGVGAKPHPDYDLASWVLSTFKKDETEKMNTAFEKAVGAAETIVLGDIDKAMSNYN